MSLFETIATRLGERKFAFKALSITQLLTTIFIFIFSIIIIINYFTQTNSDIHNSSSRFEFIRFLLLGSPLVCLGCVVMSLLWTILTFKKEPPRWMAITSIFGTVFQAVLGLSAIIVCLLLWILIGGSAMVIGSFVICSLCQVWWVIAVIGCLANIRWLDMMKEEENFDGNGHEHFEAVQFHDEE